MLGFSKVEDFDLNTEWTSRLRSKGKVNWKGMRMPTNDKTDRSYQDDFERSFEKFRNVFEPQNLSSLDQAYREMQTIKQVDQIIQLGELRKQQKPIRPEKFKNERAISLQSSMVGSQPKLIGSPRNRV